MAQTAPVAQQADPEQLRNTMLESIVHNFNQMGGMLRGATAKSMGLPNADAYAVPYPGSSNVRVSSGLSAPGVLGIALSILGAAGGGAAVMHLAAPAVPAITQNLTPPTVAAPTLPAPAPVQFDPSQWQLRVVPDTGE